MVEQCSAKPCARGRPQCGVYAAGDPFLSRARPAAWRAADVDAPQEKQDAPETGRKHSHAVQCFAMVVAQEVEFPALKRRPRRRPGRGQKERRNCVDWALVFLDGLFAKRNRAPGRKPLACWSERSPGSGESCLARLNHSLPVPADFSVTHHDGMRETATPPVQPYWQAPVDRYRPPARVDRRPFSPVVNRTAW